MSPFVWLAVAAVMALVEVLSLSLITVWFVVGSLVAFVAALAGASFIVQLVIFLLVSVVCLIVLRPIFIKYRKKGVQEEPTYIGQTAIVCEAIDNEKLVGRVETGNKMTWSARSLDGGLIDAGENVIIVDQESITFIVERKAE